jgi:hypothetical protein
MAIRTALGAKRYNNRMNKIFEEAKRNNAENDARRVKEAEDPKYYQTALKAMKRHMEDIAGQWNGDEPGRDEDRAHAASEAIACIESLEALLEELND